MKRILFIVAIIVALAGRANAQIAYRNSWGQAGTGGSNSTAVVTTAGTQAVAGDIEVFAVQFGTSSGGPPTGGSANAWTQFITGQATGSGSNLSAWWKLVAAGDIGATFTFTATSTSGAVCVIDFSGVNTTTPIDVVAGTISTGSSTTSTAAAITLVTPSDTLLFFNLPTNGAGTTTPTNFTAGNCAVVGVGGTTYSMYLPYENGLPTGTTGTVSATVPNGQWGSMLGALAPAATPTATATATATPTATPTPTLGKGCGNAGGGMCANQTIGAETGFSVSPN